MKVLVACEFSGVVREAFKKMGHIAWSVDLLPTEIDGNHFQGDIFKFLDKWESYFDLMIAHPSCTHTAVSGARWWKDKKREQRQAIKFFMDLYNTDIPKICIEHPVSIISTVFRKPEQYIQPWMFGHGETKKTGLWLKNLPSLKPTNIVEGREPRIHRMKPSKDRWKERSRFYTGIAQAMAEQWSSDAE